MIVGLVHLDHGADLLFSDFVLRHRAGRVVLSHEHGDGDIFDSGQVVEFGLKTFRSGPEGIRPALEAVHLGLLCQRIELLVRHAFDISCDPYDGLHRLNPDNLVYLASCFVPGGTAQLEDALGLA